VRKAIILAVAALFSAEAGAQAVQRKIGFSGFADGDFTTRFGSDFSAPATTTGLEIDLTTFVTFTPRLSAYLYTTLNDGSVPSEGGAATWDDLNFDGVQVDWRYTKATTLMIGDLKSASGYFNYYGYKRTAASVSERQVRGAGFRNGGLVFHTGATADSNGIVNAWSTYAEWRVPMNTLMTWKPAFRYTAGIPNAHPFELGLTFESRFEEMLRVNAHFAMNYWDNFYDAGTVLLIEPTYTRGPWTFSSTLWYNDKGEVPAPNSVSHTVSGKPLDDLLIYVEPAYALDRRFSVGLPLEFHNRSLTSGRDESIWAVPTLYAYPAPAAEVRVWTRVEKPLRAPDAGGMPRYAAGSEISFRF
jgi:hypothetical protein